jgi:hypothetical protein
LAVVKQQLELGKKILIHVIIILVNKIVVKMVSI